jgi:hypothetical protein
MAMRHVPANSWRCPWLAFGSGIIVFTECYHVDKWHVAGKQQFRLTIDREQTRWFWLALYLFVGARNLVYWDMRMGEAASNSCVNRSCDS